MLALVIVLTVVVALLALLVAGLLRNQAEILRRLHELDGGDADAPDTDPGTATGVEDRLAPDVPAPRAAGANPTTVSDLVGATPDGGMAQVSLNDTGRTTLLAFLSSGCATCRNFWDAFATLDAGDLPGTDTRVVVVTKGPADESVAKVADLAPGGVTVIMASEAWDAYAVPVSPYFLLVDGSQNRVIGEGAAQSWPQLSSLLSQALADLGLDQQGRRTARSNRTGRRRAADTDAALLAAGITPGHPSLYHDEPTPESEQRP